MKLDATLLQISAAVFIVYGGAFAYAPEWIGLIVTDSLPSTSQGMIDYRATYGGLQIGVGLFFAFMSLRRATVRTGLYGLFLLMSCMAGARYYGIQVDGQPTPMMLAFLGLELVVAVLAVWFVLADMLEARRQKRLAPSIEPPVVTPQLEPRAEESLPADGSSAKAAGGGDEPTAQRS